MIGLSDEPLGLGRRADAELWFVDLDLCQAVIDGREQAAPSLSDVEIAQAAAITTGARDRDLWRLAHIALRVVLERWAGPQVRRTPYAIGARGKPQLAAGGPRFSLAHSGSAALIGIVSAGDIGVDLEVLRDMKLSAARAEKIEAAGAALNPGVPLPAAQDPHRTLTAWVRFEAAAKLSGDGIGPHLSALRGNRDAAIASAGQSAPAGSLDVRDLAAPEGYVAAVALANAAETIEFRAFPSTAETLAAMFVGEAQVGR